MENLLGGQLVKEKVITINQLQKALERQRLHGGRLGHNLIALGFTTPGEIDTFLKRRPGALKLWKIQAWSFLLSQT